MEYWSVEKEVAGNAGQGLPLILENKQHDETHHCDMYLQPDNQLHQQGYRKKTPEFKTLQNG